MFLPAAHILWNDPVKQSPEDMQANFHIVQCLASEEEVEIFLRGGCVCFQDELGLLVV